MGKLDRNRTEDWDMSPRMATRHAESVRHVGAPGEKKSWLLLAVLFDPVFDDADGGRLFFLLADGLDYEETLAVR